jgi:hypothetical protein
VHAVINLPIPENAGRFSSGYKTGGHSSSAQLHRVILVSACIRLIKCYALNTWGNGGIVPLLLNSKLGGDKQPVSLPGRFVSRKRAPWPYIAW